MIQTSYVMDGIQAVYFNEKKIGVFVVQDDGYYGFYTEDNSGYWSSYSLRLIADKLDEFNKEWDDQVKRDIGNEN